MAVAGLSNSGMEEKSGLSSPADMAALTFSSTLSDALASVAFGALATTIGLAATLAAAGTDGAALPAGGTSATAAGAADCHAKRGTMMPPTSTSSVNIASGLTHKACSPYIGR